MFLCFVSHYFQPFICICFEDDYGEKKKLKGIKIRAKKRKEEKITKLKVTSSSQHSWVGCYTSKDKELAYASSMLGVLIAGVAAPNARANVPKSPILREIAPKPTKTPRELPKLPLMMEKTIIIHPQASEGTFNGQEPLVFGQEGEDENSTFNTKDSSFFFSLHL